MMKMELKEGLKNLSVKTQTNKWIHEQMTGFSQKYFMEIKSDNLSVFLGHGHMIWRNSFNLFKPQF